MRISVFISLLIFLSTSMETVAQDPFRDSLYQASQALGDSAKLASYNQYAAQSNSLEDMLFWTQKLEEDNIGSDSVYWNGIILHQYATISKYKGELDRTILLRKRAIQKFNRSNNLLRVGMQYSNIGNAFADMTMNDSALSYYEKALEVAQELENPNLEASAYMNISTIYNGTGDERKELEYVLKSIEISREHNIQNVLANGLFNLAVYYANKMDFESAEEILTELKGVYQESHDLYGFALIHNLRAKLAFDQNDLDAAILQLDSSMQYFKQLGYTLRVAALQTNIGEVLVEMGRYDEARSILWEAYQTFVEVKDLRYASIAMHDLAAVFFKLKSYDKSIRYFKTAIHLCDSLGFLDTHAEYVKSLAKVYQASGSSDSAYFSMLKHSTLVDSLHKINQLEAISEMETKFDTERKELEIANLQNEKELQSEKLKSEEAQNRVLYGGLTAAILLILLVTYAFLQKKKDNEVIQSQKSMLQEKNEELNLQKDIVEEKNREITDSINYAKKIQEAVLPPMDIIHRKLPNSFVFYLPKDIVAGDFYWFYTKGNTTLIAAADCTGHGVPGAMVSVVCSNALNRAVGEYGLERPADILNKCQELVVADLASSSSEIKDGMDIALVSLTFDNKGGRKTEDESTTRVDYAGAQNPLWVVGTKPKTDGEILNYSTQENDHVLYELKADKQSVGDSDDFKPFVNHQLSLEKGSRVYLFSDGYLDQFGGIQGKKLKSRNLKELILKIQHLPIIEQGSELQREFVKWKGDLEQLDDVCIIGFEV